MRRWVVWLVAVLGAVAVVLLVSLGGLDWLVADGGVVRNVLEGLSWAAAVVAVLSPLLAGASRRFRPGSRRGDPDFLDGRALLLVGGRLPSAGEVSLLDLGVKRAIDTDRAWGGELPRYVPREVDGELAAAITAGGLVLLHGRAAAGKTRTAADALRRVCTGRPVFVPGDGAALRDVVESGYALGGTVVWLDDLERFLVPGGLDLSLLHRMCPAGSSEVAVVATVRDHELAAYDAAAASRTPEGGLDRGAAELVARIPQNRRIALGQRLTPDETAGAEAVQDDDPRIADALRAEEGFAEYLAAGTAMMRRWEVGDGPLFHVGHALISAAVDCRRAGYHRPVPASVLGELCRDYLSPGWRDRDDLPPVEKGLEWAGTPVLGASSCLQPRAERTYLAADYLLDRAQAGDSPLGGAPVPETTWNAVLANATGADAVPVGVAAYDAGMLDIAETGYRQAADAGDSVALFNLGVLLEEQARAAEAESFYLRAVEAGDAHAVVNLGVMLNGQGRVAEAEDYYRQAADRGSTRALVNLGILLEEQGRAGEAEDFYRRAIEGGSTRAPGRLERLQRDRREPPEAGAG